MVQLLSNLTLSFYESVIVSEYSLLVIQKYKNSEGSKRLPEFFI